MSLREILFRGKRIDNGEWVCSGNLIHFNEGNEHYIPVVNSKCTCTHDANDNIIEWNEVMFCKVIPETVGQYTGLKDENGKRIFEGDVVRIESEIFELTGYVAFEQGCFQLIDPACDVYECLWYQPEEMTVLGNIHDNPELLEVEGCSDIS